MQVHNNFYVYLDEQYSSKQILTRTSLSYNVKLRPSGGVLRGLRSFLLRRPGPIPLSRLHLTHDFRMG